MSKKSEGVSSLEVKDYDKLRARFKTETQAVDSLVEMCRVSAKWWKWGKEKKSYGGVKKGSGKKRWKVQLALHVLKSHRLHECLRFARDLHLVFTVWFFLGGMRWLLSLFLVFFIRWLHCLCLEWCVMIMLCFGVGVYYLGAA